MWVLLLHPGATNSSGLIKMAAEAVQLLLTWVHEKEIKRAKREVAEGEEPVLPPRRQLLAGGGSIGATGAQMSLKQNRSAALCAEPELVQLISWFTSEGGIDSGAVAKFWDSITLDRPVMDKSKAYTVVHPWLGILAAGHLNETYRCTVKLDSLFNTSILNAL